MSDPKLYIGTWSDYALVYDPSSQTNKRLNIQNNPSYGLILDKNKIVFSCENWGSEGSALISIYDLETSTNKTVTNFSSDLQSALFVDSYEDYLLVAFGGHMDKGYGGGFAVVAKSDCSVLWNQSIAKFVCSNSCGSLSQSRSDSTCSNSCLTSHQFSVFELCSKETTYPFAFATSLSGNKIYGASWDPNSMKLLDLNLNFIDKSGPRHMALVEEGANQYLCVVTETSAQLYLFKITMKEDGTPIFSQVDVQYIARGQTATRDLLTGGAILSKEGNIYVTLRAQQHTDETYASDDGVYQYRVSNDKLNYVTSVTGDMLYGHTPNGLSLCENDLYVANRATLESWSSSNIVKIPLECCKMSSKASVVTSSSKDAFTWVGSLGCKSN